MDSAPGDATAMTHDTIDRTLHALFCLSRDTQRIDAASLGAVTGQSPTQAAEALLALERAGWVDASRARLTMLGLARAAQLAARAHQGGGGASRVPEVTRSEPPALRPPRAAQPRIKPPVAARPAAASGTRQERPLQHVARAGVGQ